MTDCFLYILYSEAHDKYYVGQSEDVDTRLQFHNELSANRYTYCYRPWRLIIEIAFMDRAMAMRAAL